MKTEKWNEYEWSLPDSPRKRHVREAETFRILVKTIVLSSLDFDV